MSDPAWMIYGAYGYSGTLVAEEAVRRGHQPLLAGRSAAPLEALAERLRLEHRVFDLASGERIAEEIRDFDLVLHAAGPFVRTWEPMLGACLRAGVHYVDISAEATVLES
ncbi:MAG: saccharopine dehydrogenase NADP-binding domain-containing protein, partial [Anaerolineae bacterium]